MVNNYPEYAAGVNFKKTDSNDITHFYSAQVVADPATETVESKLIKDGVVIDEGGPTVEALNVTENGTYSEEGKAYSPVVVNVAGGSSDFSTAEVSVVGEENIEGVLISYILEKDFVSENVPPFSMIIADSGLAGGTTYTVPLYKGHFVIINESGTTLEVSGNITDLQNGTFDITGNCTISAPK